MTVLAETLAAAATGVLSHLCFFIHGEHNMQAPVLLRVYLVLTILILLVRMSLFSVGLRDALATTSVICFAYSAALFSSMTIYRLFFHPLRHFPGPPLAKVSKLYHFWHVRKFKQYLFFERLYHQYGELVRTGKCTYCPHEVNSLSWDLIFTIWW